ncbi:DHA2 family efflux MFS transporter permease subunit [Corynebacterium propinquum]|uniref:MDR family MFS transporter n=1 Tax=Corynebacterium propinquum TaxID=43769 RepID=UPI0006664D3E|nr:MDR family MFS transporter [Corynebacterium propinquum]WKS31315.1 DHA2 family efflux MFS transporter permease subunit [Corynebacterium propinquum]WKS35692.1 DHA2 family efflux MFS transporter permease subunit [Corynebacterium propinquum]WKS37710.1 DHA2 family efflux MFS transporter permease subunit [Corynebacterium propinquum]WKS41945.1 DHA2 family efflux MFS transporter permease subunit [Corynebacterium propinquum]WKS48110.1 DHA2 family efflux MFS transporter permease subunit [Corynebacter
MSAQPEKLSSDVVAVLATLVAAATVMILNETSLSVALPAVMRDFGINAASAQWLITVFMLTMAVVIPTTGFLIQRFSTRQIFFSSVGLFIVGTIMGAVAPAFVVLLLGRIVQAAGTALIIPLLMTVMLQMVPLERRGTVMGFIGVVIAVAPATGPTVGGVILEAFTWHAIFLCMLPLLVGVLLLGAKLLSNVGENSTQPIDLISVVLSVVAFGGTVYSLSSLETALDTGDNVGMLVGLLVIAVIALVVFALRQVRLGKKAQALLDLRPFKIRNFSLAVLIALFSFSVLIGTVTMLPLFVQNGLGDGARTAGLIVLPGGVIQAVMSPIIGRVYDSVGPKPIMIPGAFLMAAGTWLFTTIGTETQVWQLVTFHVIFAFGFGLLMTPMMTTALSSLTGELYSHGSAILTTLQQLAAAAGTALLMVILTRGTDSGLAAGLTEAAATSDGVRAAFVVAALMVTAIIPITFFMRWPQATVA